MDEDEKEKTKRDIRFGKDGIERLERLAAKERRSAADIAREALISYEVSQSLYRDTIRDAMLVLIQACTPDELYDPANDPRQEEAVRKLGALLGSVYAAEGIQLAIMQVMAEGITAKANRASIE